MRGPLPSPGRRTAPLATLGAGFAAVLALVLAGCAPASAPATPTMTPAPSVTETPTPSPTPTPTPSPTPTFDRAALSVDDPASIWVVADKLRPLNPVDYVPVDLVDVPVAHTNDPQLRQEPSDAVVAMFQAAQAEAGLALASNSAYRSYDTQVRVYQRDIDNSGQEFADANTARPGYSEHQTGLAMDIGAESGHCSLDPCFADTPEGQWLAVNAWRFGFLLRYPADKVPVTGYTFEPWHYRYIGVALSTEMHDTGVSTLEEFFGLPAAPGYP
ncbi:M15 family metallopeptidase [Naasia lichenicola]|uniref:M15 family metallopeptidase n=1 Tax=Naasia lichenicola TaxID=2565933 RepID=UPI001E55F905|nr:M15 family metallopeptidase [Naasia lichenicola]